MLVSRNAELIEDAQVTGDAYRSVLGRVTRGHERATALRDQARTSVAKLAAGLEEAKALEARLVRLEQRRKAATKVAPSPSPSGVAAGAASAPPGRPASWSAPTPTSTAGARPAPAAAATRAPT